MSRIYKRTGSPHWQYTDGGGPHRIQKSTGTPNKRIAQLIQAKWDEERILQRHGIATKSMTCEALYQEYIELIQTVKSESWSKRISAGLKQFIYVYSNHLIGRVTVKDINNYISKRLKDDKANKTVRDEVSIVKAMFEYAIQNKYIHSNPCKNVILPAKKTKRPRQAIPHDIVKKTIDLAWREDDRIFWSLLYYTGLRVGDAGTLKPENLKGDCIELAQTKTAEPVMIPLHNELLPYKDKLVDLMPTVHRRDESRKRFQKILRENFGMKADLHSLRHSFNTHLRDLGLAYEDRKALLGHISTSKVTADYTHPNTDFLRYYINQL